MNMTQPAIDIIIIGGGASGLLLAMTLIDDNTPHRIRIIESRDQYIHDRHWGFWTGKGQSFAYPDLIANTWDAWRFSSGDDIAVHHGHEFIYAVVPSNRLYDTAMAKISAGDNITLTLGQKVTDIEQNNDGGPIRVITDENSFAADYVIDTRPPPQKKIHDNTPIFQCFFGVVIQSDQPIFTPDIAGIMDGLMVKNGACDFIYTLPMDEKTALIEYTRFAPRPTMPNQLKPLLQAHLHDNQLGAGDIHHQEGAIIPMGYQHPSPNDGNGRVIHAGLKAGNVRASSGYAFSRTLDWAIWATDKINHNRMDDLHHYSFDTPLQSWMDDLFLEVSKEQPDHLPDMFMRIGHKMDGDRFARFMMDKAGIFDILSMIWAMPKRPFLTAMFRP